jgi:hypothetical protein
MHAPVSVPLPSPVPVPLIATTLLGVAALLLLGLAALHWRYAHQLAPTRTTRVVSAWRIVGTAYALWGLGLLGLASLSLLYPYDGRALTLPPEADGGLALVILAYALMPTGVVIFALGRGLLRRADP